MSGIALLSNIPPGQAPLIRTVEWPPIVWLGNTTEIQLHFKGETEKVAVGTAGAMPADVVLVLDRSSSMDSGPGSALANGKAAAANFAAILVGPEFRAGVVAFDSNPVIIHDLSSNEATISEAIENVQSGDATDITSALRLAAQMLGSPGSNVPVMMDRRRAIILLSDGLDSSQAQVTTAADSIAQTGIDIFAVGLGYNIDEDILREIASDPDYYARTVDPRQLITIYLEFAKNFAQPVGRSGQISEQANIRFFEIVDEPLAFLSQYNPDQGLLSWALPVLFTKGLTVRYRADPLSVGLLVPAREPARMTYFDDNDTLVELTSDGAPRIFVISPLLLFLLFLPALLYALYQLIKLLRPVPQRPPPPIIVPIQYPTPGLLQLPSLGTAPVPTPLPILFIGLGWTGRWILTHLKYTLHEIHQGRTPEEFQFLCLDSANSEYHGPNPLDVKLGQIALHDDEIHLIPCDLKDAVRRGEQDGMLPQDLRWFDRSHYTALPDADLELSSGSSRRRGLARLGLLQDLEKGNGGSAIEQTLRARLDRLWKSSTGTPCQVFLMASSEGGIGSGWLMDLAVLIHRVSRNLSGGNAVSLYAILSTRADHDASAQEKGNHAGLLDELKRFAFAGDYPFSIQPPTCLTEKSVDPFGRLNETLFRRVFYFTRDSGANHPFTPQHDHFPEIADFVSLFAGQAPINALKSHFVTIDPEVLRERNKSLEYTVSFATSRTVRFPSYVLVNRLKLRILLEVIQTLIDVPPNAQSVDAMEASDDQLQRILDDWAENAYLEHHCPGFFKCLRIWWKTRDPSAVWILLREQHTVSSAGIPSEKKKYVEYLAMALTDYFRRPCPNQQDLKTPRFGKITKCRQLLIGLTGAVDSMVSSIPQNAESDKKDSIGRLTQLYRQTNNEFLTQTENWIRVLGGAIGSEEDSNSVYGMLLRKYKKVIAFETEVIQKMSPRWYVNDSDGPVELVKEGVVKMLFGDWGDHPDRLLPRFWFEATSQATDGSILPSLQLVFYSDSKKTFPCNENTCRMLLDELDPIAEGFAFQIWSYSLLEKLTGKDGELVDSVGEHVRKLTKAEPRIPAEGQTEEPIHRAILMRATEAEAQALGHPLSSESLDKNVKGLIRPKWVTRPLKSDDIHSYAVHRVIHNYPVSSLGGLRTDSPEYIHAAEVLLRRYGKHFTDLTGHPISGLNAVYGILLTDVERFRTFTLLYAMGNVRLEQFDLSKRYVARYQTQENWLTRESDEPKLYVAALRFVTSQEDMISMFGQVGTLDQSQRIAFSDQNIQRIKTETVARWMPRQELSLDDQLLALLYVESNLEKARPSVPPPNMSN